MRSPRLPREAPLQIGRLLEIRFCRVPGVAPTGQFVLTILFVCALAALLLAHHMIWVLVPAALSLLSLFIRLKRLSRWAVRAAQYASYVALGGTLVLAYIFMAYPILSQQRMSQLTLLEGLALAGFALGFLFGTAVWRPGAALIPCVLGMFILAAFNGGARLEPALALGGLAGFAYLVFEKGEAAGRVPPGGLRIQWRAALVILPATLIATGIIWTLPRAQNGVEAATANLMNASTTRYSSFMSESRLGDLEELQLSDKVVFRVWSTHPQKLRGRIFTQFDGRSWKARGPFLEQLRSATGLPGMDAGLEDWLEGIPGTSFIRPGPEPVAGIGPDVIRTKIVQMSFNPGLLISPAGQVVVRAAASAISADAHQTLTTPLSDSVQIYGVLNRRSGDLVQPGAAPPDLLAGTKGLPERLDPRMVQLAQRLAGEANSDEERIRHTIQFVQNECRYSLEVGKFHTQDPVAEFLFDKKRGYCEYFASAAAVLLRQQGIPCRYVTGFVVQEWNRQAGHFVVREADAHAWVEAYLPGRGWIEVDPTPEAEYAAARARFKSGWIETAQEWVSGKISELLILVRRSDWRGALKWIWRQIIAVWGLAWTWKFGLAGLLVLAAFAAIRMFRRGRMATTKKVQLASRLIADTTSQEARELLALVDGLWAKGGVGRPASRAPLEHLLSLPPDKIRDEFRHACQRAVEYYYSISYGRAQPEQGQIQDLRRGLEKGFSGN